MNGDRRQIADWAEQYLAGALSFERFLTLVAHEPGDLLVAELVDLVEHEPKRGGVLGATPGQHDNHMSRIRELIDFLRNS